MNAATPYFTETQPLICKRLLRTTRVIWLAAIVVLVVSILRGVGLYVEMGAQDIHFIHQVVNSTLFAPYIPTMIYGGWIAKSRPRLGTQIILVATLTMLSVQLAMNGTQAIHVMFALPTTMVLAGFFTNNPVFKKITITVMALIACLTICELIGIKPYHPGSQGYFGIRSFIYISLMILATYILIQVVVRDFFVIQQDLTDEKQRAEFIATHDPLTGLYNRYYSEQSFDHFFVAMKKYESGFVLFMDIDNFKMINTRFGHEGGDFALKVIAKRLKAVTKNKQAIVCRIGGDEFIILLICTPEGAKIISQHILNTVAKPFDLHNESFQLTCSIGLSTADKNSTFREIYRQSDTAMHRAKYIGKNTLIEHDQAHTDKELAHAQTLASLQQALVRNEFMLHYQPQIDLKSGAVIGVEALIRWKLGDKELQPDQFIEMAEQYGLIHSISTWVIQQACQDCKQLHDQGYPQLSVAVNISALLLERNNLAETVANSLRDTGLPSQALELELTESALFRQGSTSGNAQLQQIRQLGVELSVDDFGTGYSNLHYLGQLDIQKLKIDKSFVMQLTNTPNKANDLAAAIIDIAKRFQLKTIAEGIETPEIAQILRGMACEVGQGFYWSKPVSLESLLVFLEHFPQNNTKTAHHSQ